MHRRKNLLNTKRITIGSGENDIRYLCQMLPMEVRQQLLALQTLHKRTIWNEKNDHMKYHVYKKPHKFMRPYIAVHGELPKRELPRRMRHMHHHSIYIDNDIVKNNPSRARRIELHEYREMRIMEAHPGISYKKAHRRAGY
jgi:hypothetical protein